VLQHYNQTAAAVGVVMVTAPGAGPPAIFKLITAGRPADQEPRPDGDEKSEKTPRPGPPGVVEGGGGGSQRDRIDYRRGQHKGYRHGEGNPFLDQPPGHGDDSTLADRKNDPRRSAQQQPRKQPAGQHFFDCFGRHVYLDQHGYDRSGQDVRQCLEKNTEKKGGEILHVSPAQNSFGSDDGGYDQNYQAFLKNFLAGMRHLSADDNKCLCG